MRRSGTLTSIGRDKFFFSHQPSRGEVQSIIRAHKHWWRMQQALVQDVAVFPFERWRQRDFHDVANGNVSEQILIKVIRLAERQGTFALTSNKGSSGFVSRNEHRNRH